MDDLLVIRHPGSISLHGVTYGYALERVFKKKVNIDAFTRDLLWLKCF